MSKNHPAPSSNKNNTKIHQMPLLEHFKELRIRLIRSLLAIIIGFLIAFSFNKDIYNLLKLPIIAYLPINSKFIYTAPTELFYTYTKISMLTGIILASPVIFYQIWRFITPGLYKHERKLIWPFIISLLLLFITGSIFCYIVILPYIFHFFIKISPEDIIPMIKVNDYLSFSVTMLFILGLIFETPLIIISLAKLGLINAKILKKKRRYAILAIFIIAAIATPTTDIINQCLIAIPLIFFFELSIYLVIYIERKKNKKQIS